MAGHHQHHHCQVDCLHLGPILVDEEGGKEEVEGPTMAEHLYPELLCHIFSMLDTESKGRVAQVNKALSNVLLVRKSS